MATVSDREPVATTAAKQRVVALGAELRIGNAGALQATLCEALAAGGEVILDATAVQTADSAGLQLLYAFVRDSKARGVVVSWRTAQPTLRRDAGLLDLDKALGLHGRHEATADQSAQSVTA